MGEGAKRQFHFVLMLLTDMLLFGLSSALLDIIHRFTDFSPCHYYDAT